jgi:hypothetical protein
VCQISEATINSIFTESLGLLGGKWEGWNHQIERYDPTFLGEMTQICDKPVGLKRYSRLLDLTSPTSAGLSRSDPVGMYFFDFKFLSTNGSQGFVIVDRRIKDGWARRELVYSQAEINLDDCTTIRYIGYILISGLHHGHKKL